MAKKKRRDRDEDTDTASLAASLDVPFLDQTIDYLFATNQIITRRALKKVKDLFDKVKTENFLSDFEREFRVFIIKKVAELRCIQGVSNREILETRLLNLEGKYRDKIDEFIAADTIRPISDEEAIVIDDVIANKLKFSGVTAKSDDLIDLGMRIKSGDFDDMGSFMEDVLEAKLMEIMAELKGVRKLEKHSERDFDTTVDGMKSALDYTLKLRRQPGSKIRTGIQAMNDMLGGNGFECGRVYLALALSGRWKSGMLLNTVLWSSKYNNDVNTFDSTKKPCALYVTMENDLQETVERIFSYVMDERLGGDSKKGEKPLEITDAEDVDELLYFMVKSGVVAPPEGFELDEGDEIEGDPENPFRLFFKYRPNRSVDAETLEAMIEDLEHEGYEVRFLVADYTKRMNSLNREEEERHRLGSIINDLSDLSKRRNIPVLTAGQLNREAMKKIEDAVEKGDVNSINQLQVSHVGEAWSMIENSDLAFILNPLEVKAEGGDVRKFLSIKRVKMRGRERGLTTFSHPFVPGNDMRLREDYGEKRSLSVENLADKFQVCGDDKERPTTLPRKSRGRPSKRGPVVIENTEKMRPDILDTSLNDSEQF